MLKRTHTIINYFLYILKGLRVPDTWHLLKPCDILLLSHDRERSYNFEGKPYAFLIDSLGERLKKEDLIVSTIAKPYSVITGSKAYSYTYSYNRANFFGQFFNLHTIKLALNFLIEPKIFHIVWKSPYLVKLWISILHMAKAKYIIGIQPDVNICMAARMMNVEIFDLQHGVISDSHPDYGKEYLADAPAEILPTGYLCWDDQSVKTISKWADAKKIRSIKIGNPWFLRFIRPDKDDNLVQKALEVSEKNLDRSRPSILVSLQWGMRQFYPEKDFNGVMVRALEETILETQEEYNWIVRLHPVQLMGEEREGVSRYLTEVFGREKAEIWINTSKMPLPLILKNVNLHITDLSSTVIESSWMGVRSGILNEEVKRGGKNEGYYLHERNTGMAEVIEQNSEAIKTWISKTLKKGKGDIQIPDTRDIRDAFIKEMVEKCRS